MAARRAVLSETAELLVSIIITHADGCLHSCECWLLLFSLGDVAQLAGAI